VPSQIPPLTPFEHYDHGKDADPTFPDLLPSGKAQVEEITPYIGSEVCGVQLSQLTKEGKDQLALFAAQRKVVAFSDQDFAHLPIEKALEYGGYFGRHHIHQTSGAPKGFPEIHLVHRGADERAGIQFLQCHTNSVAWHSDITFENQPPVTRYIVGYKKEESDFLLKFLFDLIALSQDIQMPLKWTPGTVVVWDNRVTAHSALYDWDDGQRRHLARITPQAEAPYETPFEGEIGHEAGN
ncbi:hypothetical protein Egran_06816, partial [Elaphomyces granulatus]